MFIFPETGAFFGCKQAAVQKWHQQHTTGASHLQYSGKFVCLAFHFARRMSLTLTWAAGNCEEREAQSELVSPSQYNLKHHQRYQSVPGSLPSYAALPASEDSPLLGASGRAFLLGIDSHP